MSALAAAAAVAGLGMVAARMSRIAGVIRPEADCRRRPSSACGDSGACPKASSVISDQDGWSGMEVCCGWASIIAVRASVGWKIGGDFVVFLRFVEHQLASASWCCSASGCAFAAASFSQITSASVLRYGVKPNGERVPRWT